MSDTLRRARLLMIDDNPGDVGLFRWALQHAGVDCDLSVIGDGGEALAFVRHEDDSHQIEIPDLVVLDLNLPKVSGGEILAAMRSTETFSTVAVIIWTSSNAVSDRSQMEALRIKRYLVKPPEIGGFIELGEFIKQTLEESTGQHNV